MDNVRKKGKKEFSFWHFFLYVSLFTLGFMISNAISFYSTRGTALYRFDNTISAFENALEDFAYWPTEENLVELRSAISNLQIFISGYSPKALDLETDSRSLMQDYLESLENMVVVSIYQPEFRESCINIVEQNLNLLFDQIPTRPFTSEGFSDSFDEKTMEGIIDEIENSLRTYSTLSKIPDYRS